MADAFQHGMGAEAAREITHAFDRGVAALADGICRAEVSRQCDPIGMTSEHDDPVGTKPASPHED